MNQHVIPRYRTPEQIEKDRNRAALLWRHGFTVEHICDMVGMGRSSFYAMTATNRDLFPPRPQPKVAASPNIHQREHFPPRIDGRQFEYAFVPLDGCDPVPLVENTGCNWPVCDEPGNPLTAPLHTHACGAPRKWIGDRQLSYCREHHRMSRYAPRARTA